MEERKQKDGGGGGKVYWGKGPWVEGARRQGRLGNLGGKVDGRRACDKRFLQAGLGSSSLKCNTKTGSRGLGGRGGARQAKGRRGLQEFLEGEEKEGGRGGIRSNGRREYWGW